MIRPLVAVVVLAACNRVFGVEQTQLPPPDAPPACPSVGTPPQFSVLVQQAIQQSCSGYTTSADTGEAMAVCSTVFDQQDCLAIPLMAVGPAAGPLALIDLPAGDPGEIMLSPGAVLAPEGDEAFAILYNPKTFAFHIGNYARDGSGAWAWRENEAYPVTQLGVPSRRPRRMLVAFNDNLIHEVVQDGTRGWVAMSPAYSKAELGEAASRIDLSPDGLRAIYTGVSPTGGGLVTLYADRASVDQRFGTAVPLDVVPWTYGGPFMTEDCGRVMFSALDNILFVPGR